VSIDKNQYRPDIDGLRAVAVLSVVIHHLRASWLPGGYVGVDIFFVISGYLITAQIHAAIGRGTFSVKGFYQRRINRIVPALLVVVGATLVAGIFLVSPADFTTLAASGFCSLTGWANIFFWREYGNYFAGNSGEAMLLHTWSLGVEEQFYFVWPMCVLIAERFFSRRLVPAGVLLIVLALAVSEFGANNYASASYYLLPTRFFELAIGGTLAFAASKHQPLSGRLNTAIGLVGFALIVGSLFLLDRNSIFPGFHAIWPCLGTALLIWCGQDPGSLPARWLANRPFVFIGLLSYSLYLWHWPLIAMCRYLDVEIGGVLAVVIFFVAVGLSWFTWKFVELPSRHRGTSMAFLPVFLWRFALPGAVLALLAIAARYDGGFPTRFPAGVATYEAAAATHPNELRPDCHVPTARYETRPSANCRLGAARATADGILVGDSYANHFTGMVDVIARADDLTIMDYTMDGCPPIMDYDANTLPAYAEKCRARNAFVYEHLAATRYRYVILAAHWPVDPGAAEPVRRSVAAAVATGARVVVLLDNPTIPNAVSCPVRALMYGVARDCSVPQPAPPAYWAAIRLEFPMVGFIEPAEIVCARGICDSVRDGRLLYRDDGHLNDEGSRYIGELLRARGGSLRD
jgi:peptidoglycan/LPS O-acetylase OafA/YrhL